MKHDEKWYVTLFSYIVIAIGSVILATGLQYFLAPNTIAPGGVTGFAIVIETLTDVPIYITNLLVNIPLFIFGAKYLGKTRAIRTAYATLIVSIALKYLPIIPLTHDLLLSALFGGVLTGTGLGLVFKFEGTTGGSDIGGAMLNKKFPGLSIANFMLVIDLAVVIFSGLVEKQIETALYSVIALYVSVKVIDTVLEGIGYLKGFYIITDKPDEIADILMKELNRGVTSLKGRGMYSKKDKEVLLCVVPRSQFTRVKDIVKEIDPRAFVMIAEMYEAVGEGFKKT
ncbi:MAG: YitT family protein [Tissierella sp.]|uniref:YitT family protein n=1 Tax=Tissierella sp. TaxID=41274 RepID=UPI003F94C92C